MVNGVSVFGGYDSADWSRDIAANTTIIRSNALAAAAYAPAGGYVDPTDLDGLTLEIDETGLSDTEMATIFSGLAVEEEENFGGDDWSAAVRDKIGDDAADESMPGADHAADQGSEPGIPDVAAMLDPGELEETIRRVIREELSGEMGQRLSKNIQRMIRDQVASALFPRD